MAAITIISSSLCNEVTLANHKAASSLDAQLVCCAKCRITDIAASFQRLFYASFAWNHYGVCSPCDPERATTNGEFV